METDVETRKLNGRNLRNVIVNYQFNDENFPTKTSIDQKNVELKIVSLIEAYLKNQTSLTLKRKDHIEYILANLYNLETWYQVLDSSRSWMIYWLVNSLRLLSYKISDDVKIRLADFIGKLQNPEGGFGGGPGQMSHLAATYASLTYSIYFRDSLLKFLWSMKNSDGSFNVHEGGEIDVRSIYCALAVAKLTNIYNEKLFENSSMWILMCQTYEGGFGACPGAESHGGYTYCSLASLIFLNKSHLCNYDALLRWLVNRQMPLEGGFSGRTNKLVDGCYSFWQGSCFPLLHATLMEEGIISSDSSSWLFDEQALQEFLLICCQNSKGGMLDKPGLSLCQHFSSDNSNSNSSILGDKEINKLDGINLMDIKTKSKRILHFSDGILEELSSEDEDLNVNRTLNVFSLENENLTLFPWMWNKLQQISLKTLEVCDQLGESLANFFGIMDDTNDYDTDEAYLKTLRKHRKFDIPDINTENETAPIFVISQPDN